MINDPYAFRQEYDRFVTDLGGTIGAWDGLKASYERETEVEETGEETALLTELVNKHDELIQTYNRRVEATNSIQALDPRLLTPASARTLTEGILRDDNVLPLLRVVEDLQVLSQTVVEEEAIARALETQAQRYQALITTASVITSALLAL